MSPSTGSNRKPIASALFLSYMFAPVRLTYTMLNYRISPYLFSLKSVCGFGWEQLLGISIKSQLAILFFSEILEATPTIPNQTLSGVFVTMIGVEPIPEQLYYTTCATFTTHRTTNISTFQITPNWYNIFFHPEYPSILQILMQTKKKPAREQASHYTNPTSLK